MDKKLKVGVIGTGFIGPIHIENARRSFKAEVIALAENSMDLAKTKAALYDVPLYFDDYRKLLENKDIDVVHVCSPNFLHYQMAKDALLAGKHVVCEKRLP